MCAICTICTIMCVSIVDAEGVSSARGRLGEHVRSAAEHRPVAFSNQRDLALLVGVSDLSDRLLERYSFSPEVLFDSGGGSVWLPELELFGEGQDLQAAQADLLEEVRDYARRYLDQAAVYLASPNRAQHYPYVVRAAALDLQERLPAALAAPAEVRP